jgi:hypothetical protein
LPGHQTGINEEGISTTLIDSDVLLQPVVAVTKVNVELPEVNPLTSPASVTDATPGLLLVHEPPVVGDKFVVPPIIIVVYPVMFISGNEFTVSVRAFDVAGEPVAHASEEVNSHVTTSPSPGIY